MHRFFITPEDSLSDEEFVVRSADLVHQWSRVLRFEVGEELVLLDNSGREYVATIAEIDKKSISGVVREVRDSLGEPSYNLTLAQALLKNADKVEWVLQKGTELGVSNFVLMSTDRTERKHALKRERSERIVQEAAEQSHRGKIPILLEDDQFKNLVATHPFLIVPHTEDAETFTQFKKTIGIIPKDILVCIGPEGGFTPEEIAFARENGAHLVSLGNRILRSETAGPVLATLIAEWAGEF